MSIKRLGMLTMQMSLRGTEVAMYDYAKGCQDELGIDPIAFYDELSPGNNESVIDKFSSSMETVVFRNEMELDKLAEKYKLDGMYMIKQGHDDGIVLNSVPTLIHGVFPVLDYKFHGTVFNYVSEWLENEYGCATIGHVPHIVNLPETNEDLRDLLSIPKSATVFGAYGGRESFDIEFVKKNVMPKTLNDRSDIYFLFMNIDTGIIHDRVIHLPGCAELHFKSKFINTCDAMIHARRLGESFGLSCLEFMSKGKPLITYKRSKQRNHIEIYDKNPYLYSGPTDLLEIFMNFDKCEIDRIIWANISREFESSKVMKLFREKFIDAASDRAAGMTGIKISCLERNRSLARHVYRKINRYMDPIYDGI